MSCVLDILYQLEGNVGKPMLYSPCQKFGCDGRSHIGFPSLLIPSAIGTTIVSHTPNTIIVTVNAITI